MSGGRKLREGSRSDHRALGATGEIGAVTSFTGNQRAFSRTYAADANVCCCLVPRLAVYTGLARVVVFTYTQGIYIQCTFLRRDCIYTYIEKRQFLLL